MSGDTAGKMNETGTRQASTDRQTKRLGVGRAHDVGGGGQPPGAEPVPLLFAEAATATASPVCQDSSCCRQQEQPLRNRARLTDPP